MDYKDLNKKEKLLVNSMDYGNYIGITKKEYKNALTFLINKQ